MKRTDGRKQDGKGKVYFDFNFLARLVLSFQEAHTRLANLTLERDVVQTELVGLQDKFVQATKEEQVRVFCSAFSVSQNVILLAFEAFLTR